MHTLSVEQALSQAISCHQAGRLQDAERLYRGILQVQPRHPDANHNLGVIALQVNQPAAGLSHFKLALEANPTQGQYWLSYMNALIQTGQIDEARGVLKKGRQAGLQGAAVEALAAKLVEPDSKETVDLANLFNQGKYAECEARARALIERHPGFGFAWKVLGAIFQKQGRPEQALQAKERATLFMPNDAEAHNNLGYSLLELGRYSDAETNLRRAIILRPDYAEAHNNLGLTLEKKEQFEEAESCFLNALKLRPDYAEAYKNLGNVFFNRKMNNEAAACYEKAIAIFPDYDAAHNNLGATYFASGQFDLAILSYQKAYELKPDSSGALHNLGSVYYQQGNIAAAIDYFRKALTFKRDHWVVDSAAYLAVLYYWTDALSEAKQVIREFKSETPQGAAKLAAYFRYVEQLIVEAEKDGATALSDDCKVLYAVGESHAFSLHNVRVSHRGEAKRCRSRWILGCKQWHLGNAESNAYKRKFEAELIQLPPGSTIIATIGEIDCRPNEGVLSVLAKDPRKSMDEIVYGTVRNYVQYVATVSRQYGHKMIISGVPATNIPANALGADVREKLVQLIRMFNATLKEQALASGMDFLDVYGLTDSGDGIADGQWHLDDVHLTPRAMAECFNKCYVTTPLPASY